MFKRTTLFLIALVFSLSSYSQDCENYFIYQQNDSLTFTFQGFMVNPSQALFNWDFGDGTTASGKTVTHTFPPQGSNVFEVCLYTVTYDSIGNPCNDTSCQDITVGNAPGCVAFFFGSSSISNPLTWAFTDFSSGIPTSWSWDFGDGSTSSLQNPIHIFEYEGTFQVCLNIYDTIGNCEDEYCKEIVVHGFPGGGNCKSDFTYSSNDLLTFDFSAYMIDSVQLPVNYHWDFGDGNVGIGKYITYTYQPTGATFYPVCLTTKVFSPGGDSCIYEICHDVYVGNTMDCQALYTWAFGTQPLSVDFTDLSVGGPTTWLWDFDDSTYSHIPHPTHTFPREGLYDVCLTITNDSTGCTSTICTEVHVSNVPPPVNCNNNITSTPGADIYTFDFHGEALSNGVNVSQSSTFTWNLGDGNTATGQDITHTFGATGAYAVTLSTVSILNNSDTCVAYSFDSIFISDLSYCIGGIVYIDSIVEADAGSVHLMSFDATNNNLVMTETVAFDNAGQYLFENVNHGNGLIYYVQAELSQQSAYFGQYVPTYHYDAIHWPNANIAVEGECPPISHYNIIMQESTAAMPGSGSISGVVYSGDTKDVIEGMEVLLFNEDMEALMYIFTDENGMFEFSSLANGSYYVYPEMVGIETSGFMVTLDEETQTVEMTIIIGDGTANLSVDEYNTISIMDDLYPNPANSSINISLSAEKAVNVEISVYNQLGQEMLRRSENLSKGMNKIELNVSSLRESVYYMRLQADEGNPVMRSFIKIH